MRGKDISYWTEISDDHLPACLPIDGRRFPLSPSPCIQLVYDAFQGNFTRTGFRAQDSVATVKSGQLYKINHAPSRLSPAQLVVSARFGGQSDIGHGLRRWVTLSVRLDYP